MILSIKCFFCLLGVTPGSAGAMKRPASSGAALWSSDMFNAPILSNAVPQFLSTFLTKIRHNIFFGINFV